MIADSSRYFFKNYKIQLPNLLVYVLLVTSTSSVDIFLTKFKDFIPPLEIWKKYLCHKFTFIPPTPPLDKRSKFTKCNNFFFCQYWCFLSKWQMYYFQLKLGFSFHFISGRKHLLNFLSFVPHVYKLKLWIH